MSDLSRVTRYVDINLLLREVADALRDIFASNLVGVYLGGSLSYGDFEPGRSDIDVTVILETAASTRDCEAIGRLHWHVERTYPRWAKRIECSYIPLDMLQSVLPPRMPRPYFGNGVLFNELASEICTMNGSRRRPTPII